MHRAFNAKMLSSMTLHSIAAGSYDDDNDWIEGATTDSTIYGRMTVGNKFSQFEEGTSLHSEDGGARFSDYRLLYIKNIYTVKIQDQITFQNVKYRILQQSNEEVFGFHSYIIEAIEK